MAEFALLASDPRSLGGYEIISRLGDGASGVVFKAKDVNGAHVAIKVLRSELADQPKVRERLRREASALQKVKGGRTARVLAVEADGPVPYLVMELVPGQTLDKFVQENGNLRGGLLITFISGLVDAVSSIHAAGVVHRDLKPSNIMFGPDGVKVVDFGISALQEVSQLTGTGTFIGTASWISPEQVVDGEIGFESDIFSMGMVISFAATGLHPFGLGRADAIMYRIAHEPPDLTGVPSVVRSLVEACLTKTVHERTKLDVLQERLKGVSVSSGNSLEIDSGTLIVSQTDIDSKIGNRSGRNVLQIEKESKVLFRKKLPVVVASFILVVGTIFYFRKEKEADTLAKTDLSVTTSVKVQEIFSTGPGVVDEFKPGTFTTPIQWMACDTDGTVSPIEIRVNYTNLTSTATPIIQTAVREVVNDLETATKSLNITLGADYTETPANTRINQRAGRSELRQIYILFSPDGTLFLDHDWYPDLKDKDQGMRRRWHSDLERIQAGYIQIDPIFATTLDLDGIKLAIARQMLRILGLELVDSGNEMLTVETKTPGSKNFFKYKTTKYQYGPGETAWLQTAGNTSLCN
jgi:serine/threonine protein kinase